MVKLTKFDQLLYASLQHMKVERLKTDNGSTEIKSINFLLARELLIKKNLSEKKSKLTQKVCGSCLSLIPQSELFTEVYRNHCAAVQSEEDFFFFEANFCLYFCVKSKLSDFTWFQNQFSSKIGVDWDLWIDHTDDILRAKRELGWETWDHYLTPHL